MEKLKNTAAHGIATGKLKRLIIVLTVNSNFAHPSFFRQTSVPSFGDVDKAGNHSFLIQFQASMPIIASEETVLRICSVVT